MPGESLSAVLRFKDLGNPYLLAGLAGRIAVVHEKDSRINKRLDAILGKTMLATTYVTGSVIDQQHHYIPAKHWHGTGRYQYKSGHVLDVLQSIAEEGRLIPHYDAFDLDRPMHSISLARSRMYGRAYADMHGQGANEQERYGNSLFWACAFLGSVAVEAAKESRVWRPSGYHRMMNHLTEANALEWYKKITRQANPTVMNAYRDGSDITNNYPVLFGVRDVDTALTSRAVAIHEVRTEQPISLDNDITHVEVPRCHIQTTQRLLGGMTILAIEDGERFSSRYSFTQHMQNVI